MRPGRSDPTDRPDRWYLCGEELAFDRPVLLGVLNVTPDSFSDGGAYPSARAAVDRGLQMVHEGAEVVDVGGESTRPGAEPVPEEEEWRRVGPVIRELARRSVRVSIDTTKAEVARRALDAGAVAINDVSGLRFEPELASLAAETGAGLVIMHMRGDPRTMQDDVDYEDLVGEVRDFLSAQAALAVQQGCRPDQIVVDPGIGFGKSADGSLELLSRLSDLEDVGFPILVGPSRKSFIGNVLDLPSAERLEGTLAACVMAFDRGARLFRVHDVSAARRALDLASAIAHAH